MDLRDTRTSHPKPGPAKRLRFREASLGQLESRSLGRALLHAAAVGLAAGLVGSAFFLLLEWVQGWVLESFAGYTPLRAFGEHPPPKEQV